MEKYTKKAIKKKPSPKVTVVDLLHKDNIDSILNEVHSESMDIDRIVILYEKHSDGQFKMYQAGIANDYEQIGLLEWAKSIIMSRDE